MKIEKTSDYLAIIPSVRTFPMEYFEPLKDIDIVIIDDTSTDRLILKPKWHNGAFTVINHNDRKKLLSEEVDKLIPYKSPSCKNVGLWLAWELGYKYAILLDDDCDLRDTPDYVNEINIGKESIVRVISQSSNLSVEWFNPMYLIPSNPPKFSRGFPYEFREDVEGYIDAYSRKVTPKFNEGLWTGTPDINGVDKFETNSISVPYMFKPEMNVVIDPLIMVPISIMNIQLDTNLIPAFFQPPNYYMYGNFSIKRHDDVWSGMLLKNLMDHQGDNFTVGNPMVRHVKVPDPIKETCAETVTNIIQYHLEKAIYNAGAMIYPNGNYAEMAMQMAENVFSLGKVAPGKFNDVLMKYFKDVEAWAKIFA